MTKQALRTQLRQKRRNLDAATHQHLSIQIANELIRTPYFEQSKNIACYLANDGEVDTRRIIDTIWQQRKNCFLPIINNHTKTLTFALHTTHSPLCENLYGILEPSDTTTVTIEQLDLIITPLVGFDDHNNRLGMGGGFYDRTLATCQIKKPLLVGLAFSFQRIDQLPHENHDMKLDVIISN